MRSQRDYDRLEAELKKLRGGPARLLEEEYPQGVPDGRVFDPERDLTPSARPSYRFPDGQGLKVEQHPDLRVGPRVRLVDVDFGDQWLLAPSEALELAVALYVAAREVDSA